MATDFTHSPTPEELMEYLDGEGTPSTRDGIEAHLAACATCQSAVTDQRRLSHDLSAWQVGAVPASLSAPRPPVRTRFAWRPTRLVLAGFSAAAAILIVASFQGRTATTRRALKAQTAAVQMNETAIDALRGPTAGGSGGGRPQPSRAATIDQAARAVAEIPNATAALGPAVIRTATLHLVASDFTRARSAIEVILDSVGGFADQLALSADPGSARVLRGTLRVPGTRLTEALTRLRALGQVTHDQQNAQDVADQLVDLDARLRSSRATEQRLIDLLKQRTGKLSDVLEVEQQLTRVRLDIERLDAEKANMTRRVAYATIDLTIREARKAGLEPGPLSLWTQVRVAAADGLQTAVDTIVGVVLFALRAGPTLALWALLLLTVWMGVRRFRAARDSA